MSDAFFVPDGDTLLATAHTRGPWSDQHQHGGPPAALVGRAIERWRGDQPFVIARVTLALLRPVPIGPVDVELAVERDGRRVTTLRVELRVEDEVVVAASVLCLRAQPFAVPAGAEVVAEAARPPTPAGIGAPWALPFSPATVGYHTAIEARVATGAFGSGHMGVWMCPRVPLVLGEATTGVQRALLFADAGHGLSAPLDFRRHTFINPDLNVAFHREPVGEWLWLDARTFVEPNGVGLVRTVLADERGVCGHASQSLLLTTR